MNKKNIIIFSVVAIVLFLSLFFVGKYIFNKGTEGTKNNNSSTNTAIKNQTSNTLSENSDKSATDTVTDIASTTAIAATTTKAVDVAEVNRIFKTRNPEVGSEQIDSFLKVAAAGNMEKCEERKDFKSQCSYYFAVYEGNDGFCGDVEDKTLQFDCYKTLILNNLSEKFGKCNNAKTADTKINCLNELFWGINKVGDCAIFNDFNIRQACLDSLNFQAATKKDKTACSAIDDQLLKTYCEKLFTPGDFDKDGLFDSEELKIGTNPYSADTDGDGHSDKEEIDQGYNPCGTGKLPSSEKLLKLCSSLNK